MLLNKKDFDMLTGAIKDYSGIVISSDKEYLLESRLFPIVRKHGLKDLGELVELMKQGRNEPLLVEVIEGMTINESFFFRDLKPFDYLRDTLLPEIIAKNPEKTTYRIWSAASSTGQEAYSIAMTLLEAASFQGKKFEMIGTDIDQAVIERARDGLYSQFEVQRGIPIKLLIKYFTQEENQWRVKDDLKEMVRFDKFNLLSSPKPLGMFDIVFCRNVLIYFDKKTKEKVLKNIAAVMHPHAFILTGGAESLIGFETPFTEIEGLVSVFKFK